MHFVAVKEPYMPIESPFTKAYPFVTKEELDQEIDEYMGRVESDQESD